MIDILTPPNLSFSHLMCSQSGNIQNLATYSGHSPSYNIDSEQEPDSASRQELVPPPSLPSDMGLRYMNIPATDDVRFSPDSSTSHHSPVYSVDSTIHSSSILPLLPYSNFTNNYQPGLGSSAYSVGNPYFQQSPEFPMLDVKPRLTSLNSSPGMATPSRSPALPHPTSSSARDIYTSATPLQLRQRGDFFPRSPSASAMLRGVPLTPASSGGFTSPNMENSLGLQGASPPLSPTVVLYSLQSSDGQMIRPEIFGRIDKGFFMADNDWTCYRRNYFSLNCSYTLQPAIPNGAIHLIHGTSSPQVYGFAISIAAVVDGRDGKSIELVQHTPKRDKGPQDKPARIPLAPRPPPTSVGLYGGDNGLGGSSRDLFDQGYGQNPSQPAMEATFERIQFKNATANNGKRRAAQQYYHLLVELFADVGAQHTDGWIKIATRMSAPMVVRGRSPGHYQSERRGSNASGGGSGGAGSTGNYTPGGSSSRTGDINMSGISSLVPSSSYNSSFDGRTHYRSGAPLRVPMSPVMTPEEEYQIKSMPNYAYYPYTLHETDTTGGADLPPGLQPGTYMYKTGRSVKRFEGLPSSKGYYTTNYAQPEAT